MCDHCAKVTSQKGYAGQVTCKCEQKISSCDSPSSSPKGCCSWRQSCCGGGCCEPMPNSCSTRKQDNVNRYQKATSDFTYGYTPLEMAMNMLHETIQSKLLRFQQTTAKKKVLCSNMSEVETCYGGECGETLNKDSNIKNIREEHEEKENDLVESTIRLSER
ncbi:hypothetical protein M0804_004962 [Polistes exclamans]|nr:hypothetical protein M0804_004962 [Polistes exclamans]